MNILFICPDWAKLATPIAEEMKKQGHEVVHLDHSSLSRFTYYNPLHRILSKIFDLFSKKKYKHLTTEEQITATLNGFFVARKRFDFILFTEPNIFNEIHFDIFKKHSEKLVLSLWDSLSRMPENGNSLSKFDTIFSFDSKECEKYGFIRSYNYINKIVDSSGSINYEYDLFSVMSYNQERYNYAIEFLDKTQI